MTGMTPPPAGPDYRTWARQLNAFLSRSLSRLQFKTPTASPSESGVLVWDNAQGVPQVSKSGDWYNIKVYGGYFWGVVSSTQTAASANTAYTLDFSANENDLIDLGTPSSRIVVADDGLHSIHASLQADASSGSPSVWAWVRVNGVDVANSSRVASVSGAGALREITVSAIVDLLAGDYIEIVWASDSTSGVLTATASTAFAPSSPSASVLVRKL